ncbi:MAG: hypothetical protein ABI845_09020 [Polaromonas sp.]
MKLKLKLLSASLLASAMFAGLGLAPAMAQNTYTPGIDRAHQTISARIQQGAASGRITPAEAQALYQRGREIEMRENRFKSDGNASQQERQQLRADLDNLNADVDRMMANREVVGQRANTSTPGIDNAQHTISARIQQGMASGHITPSEAQALYRRDREISILENQYKANGNVTPPERQRLRAELDALAADVERMIANREVVGQRGNAGNTPGIDNRQFDISQRIDEGMRSGRIDQREARRLHTREREIQRHEARFKSDGVVTPQERRQLRDELTALRDEVERMMRNGRRGGRG